MHAFPNVEEVDRYISERLLIAGSQDPNVFTPEAVDHIFRCSEGIPRAINNLCDNAMLAAYSAGEQLIGRRVIEEVAENLDMLPRQDLTKMAEAAQDQLGVPGRVLKPESMDELSTGRVRHETVKPREFVPPPTGYGNGNGNGQSSPQSNGHVPQPAPQPAPRPAARPVAAANANGHYTNGNGNGNGHGNGHGNGNGNGNGHHSVNVKPYRPLADDEILLEIDGVPTRYKRV